MRGTEATRQKRCRRPSSLEAGGQEKLKTLEQDLEKARQGTALEWNSTLKPIYEVFERHNAESARAFPPWEDSAIQKWIPPATFVGAAKFGALAIDVPALCGAMPKDKHLVLPGPAQFDVALTSTFPEEGSLVLRRRDRARQRFRPERHDPSTVVVTPPPLSFPFWIRSGWAKIRRRLHLADYDEQLIHNRIWTQSTQIEQRLADLNEHMEKVIQMYLRNEYATIAEYNRQAGVIAEKYHFLVVADFPANFTDVAIKRLMSIAASGARCGVFLLLHWDRRLPMPAELMPQELRKSAFVLAARGNDMLPGGTAIAGAEVRLETPPPPEAAIQFSSRVGEQSRVRAGLKCR